MAKGIGYGSVLSVDPAGGSGYSTVGNIIDTIENEVSAEEVDTTLLGDLWKSSVPADIDPGELTFDVALDNADTTNQTLVTLMTGRTVATWQIEYANDATNKDSFSGWVKSLGRSVQKRNMLTRKVTVKLTGNAGMKGT